MEAASSHFPQEAPWALPSSVLVCTAPALAVLCPHLPGRGSPPSAGAPGVVWVGGLGWDFGQVVGGIMDARPLGATPWVAV